MGDRRRSPPRGPLGPPRGPGGGGRGPPDRGGYKVLCVSSLHPKASDDVVRDTLYREYKKYGDISVRVMHEPDERVAYVYFRNFDDARDAKHSKSRIILFDKPAMVEAVYESASREEYDNRGARPHSKLFLNAFISLGTILRNSRGLFHTNMVIGNPPGISPPRYGDGPRGGGGYGRPRTPDR